MTALATGPFTPTTALIDQTEVMVPNVIDFVTSLDYLNRPGIYPRQGTFLKIVFLQDELFTDFDHEVIAEWTQGFTLPENVLTPQFNAEGETDLALRFQGQWGLPPDIYDRIRINKEAGRKWFRENVVVIGRRGSKGHLGALCGAYVLWHYIAKGDPQGHYGIDRDKRLACMVFASKLGHARDNQWRDLQQVITGAPCFRNWEGNDLVSEEHRQSLTVFAPYDRYRILGRKKTRSSSEPDMATFLIEPKEATIMGGRGPAAFMQLYDEMAMLVQATGASRSAEEIYSSAVPALEQFHLDAFLYEGSSPWQMMGQFYQNWLNALEIDRSTHVPLYPELFTIQLESWDIYKDYQRAHQIEMYPGGSCYQRIDKPIITYDNQMRRAERANPEKFAVEWRCLDPDTRVLLTDLTWRPIREICPGDQLLAFDEQARRKGGQRHLQVAVVQDKVALFGTAYRLRFDDGSQVVCSPNHRWLIHSGDDQGRWKRTSFVRIGEGIRHLVDPWEPDSSEVASYLAGVYDGEGSIVRRQRKTDRGNTTEYGIDFAQNPGYVLDRTLDFLGKLGFNPKHLSFEPRKCQQWRITGIAECLRFLGQVRPGRLLGKSEDLWRDRSPRGYRKFKKVVAIELMPDQSLIDLETTTGTFIAEGFFSHNSHWATAMDAYLNPAMVAAMFQPWNGRRIERTAGGTLDGHYVAHADPSKSGANYGFALGHTEGPDDHGLLHVVFDEIRHWEPGEFTDNDMMIDYLEIEKHLQDYITRFIPSHLSFDQWNTAMPIQRLQRWVATQNFPKRVTIFERTANAKRNWQVAETFKTALNLGLIHAPWDELADLECRFLQDLGNNKVDHPDSGPVTTKDVFDAMSNVVYTLIGEQMMAILGESLAGGPTPAMQGGETPFGNTGINPTSNPEQAAIASQFSSVRRANVPGAGDSVARMGRFQQGMGRSRYGEGRFGRR